MSTLRLRLIHQRASNIRRIRHPTNQPKAEPMKPIRIAACVCFVFLFLVSGCARPPAPVERPAVVAFDREALRQRSDFWRNYRAKLRLRVDSEKAKFGTRAIVLAEGGRFARFETFSPIGQTTALFVLNDTGPFLFIPSEKGVFTAREPETLIRYFLGVSLPFDTFRYTLAASVPPDLADGIKAHSDAGVLHAIATAGSRYFDWQFVSGGAELKGVYVRDGAFEGRIDYEPPVPLAPEAVPKKILIASADWHMEVTVEELEPARDVQPSVFYLPALRDVKLVDLDKIK